MVSILAQLRAAFGCACAGVSLLIYQEACAVLQQSPLVYESFLAIPWFAIMEAVDDPDDVKSFRPKAANYFQL